MLNEHANDQFLAAAIATRDAVRKKPASLRAFPELPAAVMVTPSTAAISASAEAEGHNRSAAAIVVRRRRVSVAVIIGAIVAVSYVTLHPVMTVVPPTRAYIGRLYIGRSLRGRRALGGI